MRLLVIFFLLVAVVLASPREQTTRTTRLNRGLGHGEEDSKDTLAMREGAVEDLDETGGEASVQAETPCHATTAMIMILCSHPITI